MKLYPLAQDPGGQYINKLSNHLFDYIMPILSPTAWMILCFIIRKTRGWQKDWDNISISEIKRGTSIKSDTTVIKAINELEKTGCIIANRRGITRKRNTYALNTALEIETPTTPKNEVVTTPKNGVSTSENEVNKPSTTPKNEDRKEQHEITLIEKERKETPAPDYLTDIVTHQGKTSEATGPNPDDQWLGLRDKALTAFPGDWGRTPKEREIKREKIAVFVAETKDFDIDHWVFIISDCITHSVGANNIARFIEVYPYPDYNAFLDIKYPKNGANQNGPHRDTNRTTKRETGFDLQAKPTFDPYAGETRPPRVP